MNLGQILPLMLALKSRGATSPSQPGKQIDVKKLTEAIEKIKSGNPADLLNLLPLDDNTKAVMSMFAALSESKKDLVKTAETADSDDVSDVCPAPNEINAALKKLMEKTK